MAKKKIKRTLPTAERLRELFRYNRRTGFLTRKLATSPKNLRLVGKRAGTLAENGYRVVGVDGFYYKEHRVIWCMVTGRWPENKLDHENTRRDDNRFSNLREATPLQNTFNRRSRNPLGKGVHATPRGTFVSQINTGSGKLYLGTFPTAALAAAAYKSAAAKFHGEFART